MKKITISILADSLPSKVISDLDKQIPESTKSSSEFKVIYNETTACIHDFIARANKLAKTGTTIHLENNFNFDNLDVMVVLEYPKKKSMADKLKKVFSVR